MDVGIVFRFNDCAGARSNVDSAQRPIAAFHVGYVQRGSIEGQVAVTDGVADISDQYRVASRVDGIHVVRVAVGGIEHAALLPQLPQ